MAQVLQLIFQNEEKESMTISVNNPKPTLTDSEINAAMQAIIDQGIFAKDGLVFSKKKGARLVDRIVSDFALN